MTVATYNPAKIRNFIGNPMIEALPPLESMGTLLKSMMQRPDYSQDDRLLSGEERIMMTQNILRFHQPSQLDLHLARAFDKCIRWGYIGRSPLDPRHIETVNEQYAANLHHLPPVSPTFLKTYGFSVLGPSGTGKTSTIECILGRYRNQIIWHEAYNGCPLQVVQVVWIKIDCPPDGSMKSLCRDFFREVDRISGSNYWERYERLTLDSLISRMSSVASKINLGVLVIDEIQHLHQAKKAGGATKVLNFLVSLVNTIGVPVILVGTPLAKEILQQDFQQAKRASGQGDFNFQRLKQGDMTANIFLKAMWELQYTAKSVPGSDDLEKALFQETFGNPFLMTVLYMLVQENAIFSNEEAFTAADIHKVAETRLALTAPMRKAMEKGEEVNIKKYLEDKGLLDGWDFDMPTAKDLIDISVEKEAPVPQLADKASATEKALHSLIDGFGVPYNDAMRSIQFVVKNSKEPLKHSDLAKQAFLHYTSYSQNNEKTEQQNKPVVTGYTELEKAGLIGSDII